MLFHMHMNCIMNHTEVYLFHHYSVKPVTNGLSYHNAQLIVINYIKAVTSRPI